MGWTVRGLKPAPVTERSKARVCGGSLAGVATSNPAGGMDVCVVCCTVKTKGKIRDNHDKEVQIKFKARAKKKNFVGGRDFLHPSSTVLGSTQPHVQRIPGFFPGSKEAGAWG
jgi:hypothetical protein